MLRQFLTNYIKLKSRPSFLYRRVPLFQKPYTIAFFQFLEAIVRGKKIDQILRSLASFTPRMPIDWKGPFRERGDSP